MSATPRFQQAMLLRSVALRIGAVSCLAGVTLLFSGCDSRPPEVAAPAGPAVLARVGDAILTEDDLRQEVERRRSGRRPVPEKEALVREMAEHLLLAQHARSLGMDREPAVAQEIRNLLVRRLLERELAPRMEGLEVTDAEIEAEYQRTIGKYTQPGKDRLAILFLEIPLNASADRRAETRLRLEEARRRALAGTLPEPAPDAPPGFGPMALQFSDDQASRHRGGDVGWLESGNFAYRWPRPVLEAGFSLPKGGISEVIEADRGAYLVFKTDARAALVKPLAEVAHTLRQSLHVEKRRAVDAAYRQDLAVQLGMSLDAAAIAAATLPESPSKNMAQRSQLPPPALSDSESHGR